MSSINSKCPCGSGLKYKKCCKLFHDGKRAKNALELMKSRYSAFAFGQTAYIEKTTYQIKEDIQSFRASVSSFSQTTNFEKLSIEEFIDGDNEAYVSFRATLSTNNQDTSFSEKSKFIKENGIWYYVDGVIS